MMSKNLFALLLCGVVGSVVAHDQEVTEQIAPVALEQAAEASVQKEKVQSDSRVEITDDGRFPADVVGAKVASSDNESVEFSAEFKVCDEKTVEAIFVSGTHGYVKAIISTEKPEYIAALRKVTPENQEKLVNVVVEQLSAFLQDETEECDEAFYEQYEQKIAFGIQEILDSIVQDLEGAQALIKLYQDIATHICPIIDQEIAAVNSKMSVTEASWEVGTNVNNAVLKFLRNAALEAEKVVDHPLRRTPMEIRFTVMNALNQEQQNFIAESAQIQELELVGQACKDFFKKLPTLVFTILKGFYPALNPEILNQ